MEAIVIKAFFFVSDSDRKPGLSQGEFSDHLIAFFVRN